jgi:hypothetical protein
MLLLEDAFFHYINSNIKWQWTFFNQLFFTVVKSGKKIRIRNKLLRTVNKYSIFKINNNNKKQRKKQIKKINPPTPSRNSDFPYVS